VQGGPPPYANATSPPKNSFEEPPVAPQWFPRAADKIAKSYAKKFPRGDEDMKTGGYTFSSSHRLSAGGRT
jgi:hypothetical protein